MNSNYKLTGVFIVFYVLLVQLCAQAQSSPPALLNHLYEADAAISIVIHSDYKRLLRRSIKEEYEPAVISIKIGDKLVLEDSSARIRSRGNTRKEVCKIPPFKLDFSRSELIAAGLDTLDNLKLVLPCRNKKGPQQRLYKEKLAYDLFDAMDTNGLRTVLVNVTFTDNSKILEELTGFIVEDEHNYVKRKNAKLVGEERVIARDLDRQSFLKMTFFQYMISNTDWAVSERHNLEVVKLPDMNRAIAIPYDFDYSGFVNQPYAVPHSLLPIESVTDRYFHPYKIRSGEFRSMMKYFESKKKEKFYAICEEASFMNEKSRGDCKKHIASFYNLFENDMWLRKHIKD